MRVAPRELSSPVHEELRNLRPSLGDAHHQMDEHGTQARMVQKSPWTPRQVRRPDYETAHYEENDIIWPGSEQESQATLCLPDQRSLTRKAQRENFHKQRLERHKRRQILGQQYLAGRPLNILSAQLRGPFDTRWQNPWREATASKKWQSSPRQSFTVDEPRISLPNDDSSDDKRKLPKRKFRRKDILRVSNEHSHTPPRDQAKHKDESIDNGSWLKRRDYRVKGSPTRDSSPLGQKSTLDTHVKSEPSEGSCTFDPISAIANRNISPAQLQYDCPTLQYEASIPDASVDHGHAQTMKQEPISTTSSKPYLSPPEEATYMSPETDAEPFLQVEATLHLTPISPENVHCRRSTESPPNSTASIPMRELGLKSDTRRIGMKRTALSPESGPYITPEANTCPVSAFSSFSILPDGTLAASGAQNGQRQTPVPVSIDSLLQHDSPARLSLASPMAPVGFVQQEIDDVLDGMSGLLGQDFEMPEEVVQKPRTKIHRRRKSERRPQN